MPISIDGVTSKLMLEPLLQSQKKINGTISACLKRPGLKYKHLEKM